MPSLFSHRSPNQEIASCAIQATACLVGCGGTAVAGWIWGTHIWNAMEEGGLDLGERITVTVLAAGGFSVFGGLIAMAGVGTLAALAYCGYQCCCATSESATANAEIIATNAQRIIAQRGAENRDAHSMEMQESRTPATNSSLVPARSPAVLSVKTASLDSPPSLEFDFSDDSLESEKQPVDRPTMFAKKSSIQAVQPGEQTQKNVTAQAQPDQPEVRSPRI